MTTSKSYNLFISHAWRYDKDYYNLEDKLCFSRDYKCRSFSNPENDPLLNPKDPLDKKFLVKDLEEQIRPAHCVLIISEMYDRYKQWIQKEIDIAKSFGKPIIGIKSSETNGIPKAIQNVAVEIVPIGKTKQIIKAIMSSLIKKKEFLN